MMAFEVAHPFHDPFLTLDLMDILSRCRGRLGCWCSGLLGRGIAAG
jgi:hypothetical protein